MDNALYSILNDNEMHMAHVVHLILYVYSAVFLFESGN